MMLVHGLSCYCEFFLGGGGDDGLKNKNFHARRWWCRGQFRKVGGSMLKQKV